MCLVKVHFCVLPVIVNLILVSHWWRSHSLLNTLEHKVSNIFIANQLECVNRLILISQPLPYPPVSGNAGSFSAYSISSSLSEC